MIASRSTTMNGATSANSTAVCPCSEVMRRLVFMRRCDGGQAGGESFSDGAREGVGDEAELAVDCECQRTERHRDGECDQREKDAVLGHRLRFFAPNACAEKLVPQADLHLVRSFSFGGS